MQVEWSDQAAGLRRRSARVPICTYCFFDTAQWMGRLAISLHHAGKTSLLIDRQGRLFGAAQTRSLFSWKQQLERGELHTLPLNPGEGWHAPGVRADDPALPDVARAYDHLLFDEKSDGAALILMPGAYHAFLVEVQATRSSMLRAYTLLKTLSHHVEAVMNVNLLGDQTACAQVLGAASHFLPLPFAQAIDCVAHADTAFSALAVRMPGEETSQATRFKTENMKAWP
ncbi:MAG: hypothetical protein Q7U80_05440 [Thiobacillus sp.]|nr:hypothetical protein [Thiobacillus sp.]